MSEADWQAAFDKHPDDLQRLVRAALDAMIMHIQETDDIVAYAFVAICRDGSARSSSAVPGHTAEPFLAVMVEYAKEIAEQNALAKYHADGRN